MTSELVIRNNDVVVLAADSALTVGNTKVFNGVSKLFELPGDFGVMISGDFDINGISAETLIKQFAKNKNFEKGNIFSIKDNLLTFIGENVPDTDFEKKTLSLLDSFKDYIQQEIGNGDDIELISFLESMVDDLPLFIKEYEKNLDDFDYYFKKLIPSNVDANHLIILSFLKKIFLQYFVDSGTGIVIVGFNKKDFHSSRISFNMYFNHNSHIEISDYEESINFKGVEIFPVAQSDVIETFVFGIDPLVEISIFNLFINFHNKCLNELRKDINSNTNIQSESLNIVNHIFDDFDKTVISQVNDFKKNFFIFKKMFVNKLLFFADALPKYELADMAQYLIPLTALKRKINSNLNTVGGDIDVAIITKGDGFIWRKHKEYSDTELKLQIPMKNLFELFK